MGTEIIMNKRVRYIDGEIGGAMNSARKSPGDIETVRRLVADFMNADGSLSPAISQEPDGSAPPLVNGAPRLEDAAATVELLGDVAMVSWAEVVHGDMASTVVVNRLTLLRRSGRWIVMPALLH